MTATRSHKKGGGVTHRPIIAMSGVIPPGHLDGLVIGRPAGVRRQERGRPPPRRRRAGRGGGEKY